MTQERCGSLRSRHVRSSRGFRRERHGGLVRREPAYRLLTDRVQEWEPSDPCLPESTDLAEPWSSLQSEHLVTASEPSHCRQSAQSSCCQVHLLWWSEALSKSS